MKPIRVFPLLLLALLSCPASTQGQLGKFAPPRGKTLVAVGNSWSDSLEAYTRATGHTPQGVKIFCGFTGQSGVAYFNHHARNLDADGRFLVVEFALDPASPKKSPKDSDKLSPFLRGEKDAGIEAMGRAIKRWGRPVFAVLGYEFDWQHPHQPRQYAAVFRRIHDAWDALGVTNVAYVWHSYTDNLCNRDLKMNKTEGQLYEFYPGDGYVDWFGVSVYYQTQRRGAIRLAQMARAKGKPVAVIESGVGVNPNPFWDFSWDGYYGPMFRTVEQLNVGLLCYNNFGDGFAKFSDAGNPFRNTQMDRMPNEVRQGWARMMKTPRFTPPQVSNETRNEAQPTLLDQRARNLSTAELRKALVTGDWRHRAGNGGPAPIRFIAPGKINDPNGRATWSLKGSTLTLRWPDPNASGGAWIDRCTMSGDGRTYSGANQAGLPIRGILGGN